MKKVAVIGLGFMGATHALNILKNDSLELVAIVDKDPEAIDKALQPGAGNLSIEQIGIDRIKGVNKYTTFEECLKNEKLDAVHICTHTDSHYGIVKKALNHGLHVLVEKPFTLDLTQGEELINLANEKGLILMVAHVVRFMAPYQKLKEWADTGKYGKLKFLSLSRFSGIPQWGQWKEKQEAFGSSGGALFDLVIHDIDFALSILGRPGQINSFCLPGKLSKYDYVSAIWRYPEKSVSVKIEGGNIFHVGFPFQAGFIAQFEKASISYSTLQPEYIVISDNEQVEKVVAGNLETGYYNEIDYFAGCMENKRQPLECMPESSLEAIRICYRHLT